MGFNMNWTQSYAANKNAQKANQNAQNATNAALAAAMASQQSSQASKNIMDSNLMIVQMISEMRDWETTRFNDVIAALRNRKHENEAIMTEIKALHKQVAELQAQLYQEQEKNKGFVR